MSNPIALILENTKNHTSSTAGVVTIYQNTDATLEVSLINNSSASIDLSGSNVDIQLPIFLKGVGGIKVTGEPAGFGPATYDNNTRTFSMKYSGSEAWGTGSSNKLIFTIENIKTDAQPPKQPQLLAVLLSAGSGYSAQVNIALTLPPKTGNIDFHNVLDVVLQNDNILVSDPDNPLPDANKLKLTFSNLTNKAINFDQSISPNASVTVSFLVGNTDACLTQEYNTGDTDEGSIKNIKVSGGAPNWGCSQAYDTSGSGNNGTNPTGKGALPFMSNDWTLTPNSNVILGDSTSGQSTVTFEFDHIYSFTDIGTTLMYVYFSGFNISDTQAYNDQYFIIPIFKESITPKLSNLSITPQIVKYSSDGVLNTIITPSWDLSPPQGKTEGDVQMSIKVTSVKNPINNKTSPISHSQNGQGLNLLTYCTWTKDLSSEEGIDVEIIASVTQTDINKKK